MILLNWLQDLVPLFGTAFTRGPAQPIQPLQPASVQQIQPVQTSPTNVCFCLLLLLEHTLNVQCGECAPPSETCTQAEHTSEHAHSNEQYDVWALTSPLRDSRVQLAAMSALVTLLTHASSMLTLACLHRSFLFLFEYCLSSFLFIHISLVKKI